MPPALLPAVVSGSAGRLERLKAQHRLPGEASFFYFDARFNSEAVKVLPGEYFVCDEDIVVTTTLGSCIAACLWDRDKRIGGMNHFLLPDMGTGSSPGSGGDSGRYGGFAMDQLIAEMIKRGATRSSMEAKVFGGGAVVSGMSSMNVGERNTAFVLEYLRAQGIPVVSKDVMDNCPRKVCFLPVSGKAMVKRLAIAIARAAPAAQEQAAARNAAAAAAAAVAVAVVRKP